MEDEIMIYDAQFSDRLGYSITNVSFVDNPAMKVQLEKFDEIISEHFEEERKIVTSVLLLSDTPIRRRTKDLGDFYIRFPKSEVIKMASSFLNSSFTSNTSLFHSTDASSTDATLFESFIVDESRGIRAPEYFKDVTDGSWIVSYKINNAELWDKIKAGTIKGLSVENTFDLVK
jgi:hypothetical protein